MVQRLIPGDPRAVMRRIAEAYLAAPVIAADQGEIRLAPHQVDAASRLLVILEEHGARAGRPADWERLSSPSPSLASVSGLLVVPAASSMCDVRFRSYGSHRSHQSYEALSRASLARRPASPAYPR